jgi:hypothetical protein
MAQDNKFFGIKVSKQGINVNNANDNELILKDSYTTRTYYDANNPRLLIGQLPDNSYGIWSSKSGIDVTKATAGQLTFNSNASFTVATSGSYSFPGLALAPSGNTAQSTTIAHNLGYIPYFQLLTQYQILNLTFLTAPFYAPIGDLNNNRNIQASTIAPINQPAGGNIFAYAGVDTTNLYIELDYSNPTGGTLNFAIFTINYVIYSLQI